MNRRFTCVRTELSSGKQRHSGSVSNQRSGTESRKMIAFAPGEQAQQAPHRTHSSQTGSGGSRVLISMRQCFRLAVLNGESTQSLSGPAQLNAPSDLSSKRLSFMLRCRILPRLPNRNALFSNAWTRTQRCGVLVKDVSEPGEAMATIREFRHLLGMKLPSLFQWMKRVAQCAACTVG